MGKWFLGDGRKISSWQYSLYLGILGCVGRPQDADGELLPSDPTLMAEPSEQRSSNRVSPARTPLELELGSIMRNVPHPTPFVYLPPTVVTHISFFSPCSLLGSLTDFTADLTACKIHDFGPSGTKPVQIPSSEGRRHVYATAIPT